VEKRVNRIARAAKVLGVHRPRHFKRTLTKFVAVLLALTGIGLNAGIVNAATLTSASVALSDPRPSQTAVTYTFTGSSVTNAAIRCVRAIFSTTSTGDTAPTGFDGTGGSITAGSSTLVNSSGTGWTLATSDGTSSTGQDNIWQYTRSSDVTPGTLTGATFIMAGITNPSTADTAYYVRFNTFSDQACTTARDNAIVEYINTNGSTLSLTVDNTLSFTVNSVASSQSCNGTTTTQASTATTIPFGTVTSASNGVVCQDLTAATNATNGYTIFVRNTQDPTNALSQTIADHSGTNAAPAAFPVAGNEAYAYSTNDASLGTGTADRFTNPSQGWARMAQANEEVAYEAAGVTSTTYRIGHQVGIATTTEPGTYSTVVLYTCTPVY
jgi:hypothetical protein